MRNNSGLPETGFLRLPEVLGFYPVSRSTWWKGIQQGRFPSPVRIGQRAVAWRAEDIRALIQSAAARPVECANAAGRANATKSGSPKSRLRKRLAQERR